MKQNSYSEKNSARSIGVDFESVQPNYFIIELNTCQNEVDEIHRRRAVNTKSIPWYRICGIIVVWLAQIGISACLSFFNRINKQLDFRYFLNRLE